jgi:hypothetical protein
LVQWGGIEYAVSFVPHNATEYNFDYSVGYLASIFIYRFPMEHWSEYSIAKAVSPFGALVAVDPVYFTDRDFSTISIVVHVECISKIPRILVVKEGGHGTLAWIDVAGFLDLSLPPSPPPSPPLPPAPGFIPVFSSSSNEDSLAGFSDETFSDRLVPRCSPVSVLGGPGGSSSAYASQDIAEHIYPSEEALLAVPESLMEQMEVTAMMMAEEADESGVHTPTPSLPAPGFALSGGLEDVVRPVFTETMAIVAIEPSSSPKIVRHKESRAINAGEDEVYDISSLFNTPPPQMAAPHEVAGAAMQASQPRRSKRFAQLGDEYVSVVDRAVQKKARDVQALGDAGKAMQPQKKLKGLALDENKAAIPALQVGDLLYLAKAFSFTEAELMKISEADEQGDDE